jgi:hypothetical protein
VSPLHVPDALKVVQRHTIGAAGESGKYSIEAGTTTRAQPLGWQLQGTRAWWTGSGGMGGQQKPRIRGEQREEDRWEVEETSTVACHTSVTKKRSGSLVPPIALLGRKTYYLYSGYCL